MNTPVPLSLSMKEREQLTALLQSEKNVKLWKRYRAILVRSEVNNPEEAAKIIGISTRQLSRHIEAFRQNGIEGVKIKKQTGRPPFVSKKKQEKIVKIIDSNPYGWSTKQIQKLVSEECGIRYSKRQVYRISQKWGFAEVTPRPKSNRRASESTVYRFKKKPKKSSLTPLTVGK